MGTFSQRLIQARKRKNMSQAELSSIAGVSTTTLSAYENNGRPPALDVAKKIADALDVSLDWLADTGKQAELTDYSRIENIIYALVNIAHSCDMRIKEEFQDDIEYGARQWFYLYFVKNSQYTGKDNYLEDLVCEFIDKWEKTLQLYIDDVIDDELYSAWLEKITRTLKEKQTEHEKYIEEEEIERRLFQ